MARTDASDEWVHTPRKDLMAEFLDRYLDDKEPEHRDRIGQQQLLENLEDDAILSYVAEIEAE